jgi:hypothetical protein
VIYHPGDKFGPKPHFVNQNLNNTTSTFYVYFGMNYPKLSLHYNGRAECCGGDPGAYNLALYGKE